MITSTVTNRGQTTLPKEVREALALDAGSKVTYQIEKNAVIIRKPKSVLDSFGALKRSQKGGKPDFKRARKTAHEEWADEASKEGNSK